jgi:hypothetical protein
VLNVGGFGDAVWEVVAAFALDQQQARVTDLIERVPL